MSWERANDHDDGGDYYYCCCSCYILTIIIILQKASVNKIKNSDMSFLIRILVYFNSCHLGCVHLLYSINTHMVSAQSMFEEIWALLFVWY